MPTASRQHSDWPKRLAHYGLSRPLVLAIPRGAVPMGKIVADTLGGELDVVLVRKLGAPGNPEYAIGAVSEGGEVLVEPQAEELGIAPAYVEAEASASSSSSPAAAPATPREGGRPTPTAAMLSSSTTGSLPAPPSSRPWRSSAPASLAG